jgi:large subunit ribosomal protein L9
MKVILLRDVAKIGRRYEIVEVPDGYALNKLIPKKDAEAATPVNVKRVLNMRQKDKSDKDSVISNLKKIVSDLKSEPLAIPAQSNELGHLFQSIHAEDVVIAAKNRGVSIDKEYVVIDSPIKSTGSTQIHLSALGEKFVIEINVVPK